MSAETLDWLNANVMYGYAATRSTWGAGTSFGSGLRPWFAHPDYQHLYDGPIPVADVESTLFHWTPVEAEVDAVILGPDGQPVRTITDHKRKAIVRPDTGTVLGIFGRDSYKVHDYRTTLLRDMEAILDTSDELGVSSAGLLREGGQAWVSIELPDDIEVAGAGHIRPCIIAATSLDGTLATVRAVRIMRPECDNSLRMSLSAKGQGGTVRIKHSSNSLGRIDETRNTLGIIYAAGELAVEFFDMLTEVDVTERQFQQIVAQLHPMPDPKVKDGKVTNQRSINNAERRRDELTTLWTSDPRAAAWNGTLAGAYHAVSTHQQHNVSRDDLAFRRVMTGTLTRSFDEAEDEFWRIVYGMDIEMPAMAEAVAA